MIGWVNTPGSGGVDIQKNKPVIHVNAPIGSTIDFILNGIIVKNISAAKSFLNMDGKTADYYYSCPSIGTWTVTATLGTDTISDTVTINSNQQYDIVLDYSYLFKSGRGLSPNFECTFYKPNNGTINILQDYIFMGFPGQEWGNYVAIFTPAIDLTKYKTLFFDVETTGTAYAEGKTERFGICDSTNNNSNFVAQETYLSSGASSRITLRLDITNFAASYYIKCHFSQSVGNIYNVWITED